MTESEFLRVVSTGGALKLNKNISILFTCTDVDVSLDCVHGVSADGRRFGMYPAGTNAVSEFDVIDEKTQRLITKVRVEKMSLYNLAALFEEEE